MTMGRAKTPSLLWQSWPRLLHGDFERLSSRNTGGTLRAGGGQAEDSRHEGSRTNSGGRSALESVPMRRRRRWGPISALLLASWDSAEPLMLCLGSAWHQAKATIRHSERSEARVAGKEAQVCLVTASEVYRRVLPGRPGGVCRRGAGTRLFAGPRGGLAESDAVD